MQSDRPRPDERPKSSCLIYMTLLSVVALIILVAFSVAILQPRPPLYLYFAGVQAVSIHEHWNGLAHFSPVVSNYDLRWERGQLIGTVDFSVGQGARQATNSATVTIPAATTTAFFIKLKQCEIKPGSYQPTNTDYSIHISIAAYSESIELLGQSARIDGLVWGLHMRGHDYIINSSLPAQALAIINPYLQKDVLGQLIASLNQ